MASLENKFPLLCLRVAVATTAERDRQRHINTDRFNPTAIQLLCQLHQEYHMFCGLNSQGATFYLLAKKLQFRLKLDIIISECEIVSEKSEITPLISDSFYVPTHAE